MQYIPPVWLTSYIIPIYKKGSAANANNYRPIALTAAVSKIETIVKNQIVLFLATKGVKKTSTRFH